MGRISLGRDTMIRQKHFPRKPGKPHIYKLRDGTWGVVHHDGDFIRRYRTPHWAIAMKFARLTIYIKEKS